VDQRPEHRRRWWLHSTRGLLAMTRFLAVTGGHSVDIDAFRAMLDSISNDREWQWAHAVQPSAQRWFNAKSPFDAIVCHDIPGLKLKRGVPPQSFDPDPQVVESMQSLFEAGTGLVILHHALAGWPTWDRWATALGGRFLYAPGELRSNQWPSSGTRITGYTARIETPEHPVVAGVSNFSLTDELYCCPVFESEIVPLISSDADFSPELFISTYEHVIVGEDAAPRCLGHPQPSNLIGWASSAGNSPIVYIQPGDSAATFGLAPYRLLVGNAIEWVSSPQARTWAEARRVD
jgi:uncharacterized protein